ncbi:MAG: SpvB/TcaC N-terminal domain-containing protein [Bacteroidaceae bacterium]|jgi:RHS repeat-associated protein
MKQSVGFSRILAGFMLAMTVSLCFPETRVGRISGAFSTSNSGAAVYTVPVDCPSAPSSVMPQLSLVYNSQSGAGIAGWGWSLSGLSSISRVPRTYYYDGGNDFIKWNNSDIFALDGQRLFEYRTWNTDSIEYKTESDPSLRVVAYDIQASGPSCFKVYTKSGLTLTYGKPSEMSSYTQAYSNTKSWTSPSVFAWNLMEAVDQWGNYMEYHYKLSTTNGQAGQVIDKIVYGVHKKKTIASPLSVVFTYENRPDDITAFVAGKGSRQQLRLCAIKTMVGTTLRKEYRLSYASEQKVSRLASIDLYDRGIRLYEPLTFTYGEPSEIEDDTDISFITKDANGNNKTKSGLVAVDLDGDGYPELGDLYPNTTLIGENIGIGQMFFDIHAMADDWEAKYRFPVSFGMGIVEHTNTSTPVLTNMSSSVSCQFADFDGDGSSESVYAFTEGKDLHLRVTSRKGYDTGTDNLLFEGSLGSCEKTPFILVGHYTYHPLAGVIVIFNDPQSVNGGYRYRYRQIASAIDGSIHLYENTYDLILPGKIRSAGLYQFLTSNCPNDMWVELEDGRFFIIHNNSWYTNGCFTNTTQVQVQAMQKGLYAFGDLNGDGLSDILHRKGNAWYPIYNKGNYEFEEAGTLQINCQPQANDNDQAFIADFNCDGLADIVVGDEAASGSSTTWRFYRNDADAGFTIWRTFSSPARASYACLADLKQTGALCWVYQRTDKVLLHDFGFRNQNVLRTVTNPMTGTATFTYRPQPECRYNETETEWKNVLSSSCLLIRSSQTPVIASYKDGRNEIEFEYGTLLYNWTCRGIVGFKNSREHDLTNDFWTTRSNSFDKTRYLLLPQSAATRTSPEIGSQYNVSSESYTYSIVPGEGKSYALQLKRQSSSDDLNGTSTITTYTYDDYGNPLTSVTESGGQTVTTETSYAAKGAWCPNAPLSMKITKEYGTDRKEIQITYAYDSQNHLQKETYSHAPSVTYADWDVFGRPGKVTTAYSGTESVIYSASGRFPVQETDRFGNVVQKTWDEARGLLLSETDRHGTTTYTYDSFGDLRQTLHADGTRTQLDVAWASGSSNSGVKYREESRSSGEAPVWIGYNEYGQEVERRTYGAGNREIRVFRRYDSAGRLSRVSKPTFSESPSEWMETYTYDDKNRVKSLQTPQGTVSYTYRTRGKTVVSPTRTVETDWGADGYLTRSVVNDMEVRMTNTVDGRVTRYEAVGSGFTSYTYDAAGRPASFGRSDAGTITYVYNPDGQILSIDDPANGTFTYHEYNGQGQLVDKSITGSGKESFFVHYTYDSYARLKSMSTSDGCSISYDYDAQDRVTRRTDKVGSEKTMVTEYEYDSCGRVSKYTYPSGYYILNIYDANGYLVKVTDGDNRLIWELGEADAEGNVLGETKGQDNVAYSYDAAGRQLRMMTSLKSGNIDWAYIYYENGNLKTRSDVYAHQTDSFTYDALDRLVSWNVVGSSWKPGNLMGYAANGNITGRTSNERQSEYEFQYGNFPPHAPTQILGRFDRTAVQEEELVTYTAFKKIKTLSYGANGTSQSGDYPRLFTYTYGPDEQRMKVEHEVTWNHMEINKKYYAPDYEEEDFYNRKRKLHYIYGGNGLAAVCIIENGGTTVYSAYTDFQGSLVALTSHSLLIEKYAYDPWGMRRDPYDWTKPDTREVSQQLSPYLTDRGYTMHEHIPGTDLIDMNGRVYDCTTATFLSCDPYVQDPGNWLNHNPYTYCLNNPLKYTDPSGEFIHLLAGGFLNWAANGFKFNLEGLGYFGVGAFSAGIFSGLAGGIANTFVENGSFWGGFASNIGSMSNMPWKSIAGFGRGFATFGAAGLGGGFFTGFGNSLVGGNGLGSSFVSGLKSGIIGGAAAGVIGGVAMGAYAKKQGYNFRDGLDILNSETIDKGYAYEYTESQPYCVGDVISAFSDGKVTVEDLLRLPENTELLEGMNVDASLAEMGKRLSMKRITNLDVVNKKTIIEVLHNKGDLMFLTSGKGSLKHLVLLNKAVIQSARHMGSSDIVTRLFLYVMSPGRGRYYRIGLKSIEDAIQLYR